MVSRGSAGCGSAGAWIFTEIRGEVHIGETLRSGQPQRRAHMGDSTNLEAVLGDIAPTGVVRAAINVGNPVLAGKDPAGGEPHGVSVDIAREVGKRLGRPVEFIVFETAGLVVDALARGEWDVAFLANEP